MFDLIETTAGLIKINRQTGRAWLYTYAKGTWVRIRYSKGDK